MILGTLTRQQNSLFPIRNAIVEVELQIHDTTV